MFWEKCSIKYFSTPSGEFVKVIGNEVTNNSNFWVYLPKDKFDKLQNGTPINRALEDFPLEIKEFLICGFAPAKKSIFPFKRETTQKAYVTNAVANSIAFYAMAYLNNQGLKPEEIRQLRFKYSLQNIESDYFSLEELKHSFESQSAFFLNLYKEMNANDRFEKFAESLELQRKFKEVFGRFDDVIALKKQYNRRIFHDKLECKFMRSDYEEETIHKNSGVFTEKRMAVKPLYYSIDRQYLENLKMRLCKICART